MSENEPTIQDVAEGRAPARKPVDYFGVGELIDQVMSTITDVIGGIADDRNALAAHLRQLVDVIIDLYGDHETCEDCGDIGERPCQIHESSKLYAAMRAAFELLGPCECGHACSSHHDEETTRCRLCACESFRLPAAVAAGKAAPSITPDAAQQIAAQVDRLQAWCETSENWGIIEILCGADGDAGVISNIRAALASAPASTAAAQPSFTIPQMLTALQSTGMFPGGCGLPMPPGSSDSDAPMPLKNFAGLLVQALEARSPAEPESISQLVDRTAKGHR
jgi:hypothetical protein